MMKMATLVLVLAAAGSIATAAAAAQPVKCKKVQGLQGPFVPNPESARAIFLAVEKTLNPKPDLKIFPVVDVRDKGDHWLVERTAPKDRPMVGGGQLQLQINKCTGAISQAWATQ